MKLRKRNKKLKMDSLIPYIQFICDNNELGTAYLLWMKQ